jgi:hypothetical protein
MTHPRLLLSLAVVALLASHPARANAPPGRVTYPQTGTVYDTKTKLTWQQAVDAGPYTLPGATTYCSSLALAGGSWRMPTVKELLTLVDVTIVGAATIDPVAFPNTQATYFWSSTTLGTTGWDVDFGAGEAGTTGATLVRCVR